jgi:hypothetical protein
MALLRRHKALILAKNVLYIEKSDDDEQTAATDAAPLSGALFFSGKVPRV